jgi:hypothetical protein
VEALVLPFSFCYQANGELPVRLSSYLPISNELIGAVDVAIEDVESRQGLKNSILSLKYLRTTSITVPR